MTHALPALAADAETIADLRALYRAAEARAARLRLLSMIGRELAGARGTIEPALDRCAAQLALFLGRSEGRVVRTNEEAGLPIRAPAGTETIARLQVPEIAALRTITNAEDRDTVGLALDLIGAAIDRSDREAERDALVARLAEREQRLEMLVGRILSAQEDERRRVSHDLHDGVAQTATALVRMIEGAGGSSDRAIEPAERQRLAGIGRHLLRDLRAVIAGLRPPLLDDLGLASALRALAEGLEEEGYSVTLRVDDGSDRLPPAVETAFYRVAQEAIANIRKHAGAPCGVTVELAAAGGDRCMIISDTGRGFKDAPSTGAPSGDGHHVGLAGMRERMTAIGGRLELASAPGGGAMITACLPDNQSA